MIDILKKFQNRKILAITAAVLLVGGYYGFGYVKGAPAGTSYVLSKVAKGTLISSINGTGQVSASNQLDIKPKVSGEALLVDVKVGQNVKSGDLLVRLDDKDAQKAVRDAVSSLESAKLSMEKLKKPADELSIMQAENNLTQAEDSLSKLKLTQEIDYQKAIETKQDAESDLKKTYDDGFNSVSNTFLDLPAIMSGLQDMLYGNSFNTGQTNLNYYSDVVKIYDSKAIQYRDDADDSYQEARKKYDKAFADYKAATRTSDTATIEALIDETYDTTKSIADTVKSANNLIQFYKDKLTERGLKTQSAADTHLSSLSSYTTKTNSYLLNLLAAQSSIKQDKDAILNADRSQEKMNQNNPFDLAAAEQSVEEKKISLAKLKAGADPFDIRSQELSVKQKEIALSDASEKLSDYSVKAPFDGVIAAVNIKKGDSVSASTAIATLITTQKIATISVNEVDAVKIKTGQKAILTFDAIPDLSISGQVAEIDTLGTVTQGVVNYSVKIGFDTQDDRVKPGMSATVAIIIDIKQDVLMVPNSALKTSGNSSYVEIFDASATSDKIANGNTQQISSKIPPKGQTVEIGSANDSDTEILSGLSEGDWIVTRMISSASATSASGSQRSGGFGGMLGGGGGGVRMGR